MKTSELTGDKLDYWVAKAQGWNLDTEYDDRCNQYTALTGRRFYTPSTNWQQCGELIEKFEADLGPFHSQQWIACVWSGSEEFSMDGITPQEAICRAVVASVYGEEVPND